MYVSSWTEKSKNIAYSWAEKFSRGLVFGAHFVNLGFNYLGSGNLGSDFHYWLDWNLRISKLVVEMHFNWKTLNKLRIAINPFVFSQNRSSWNIRFFNFNFFLSSWAKKVYNLEINLITIIGEILRI